MVMGIVASEDLYLEQLNVKTTFPHGDLKEDIYMTQPEGSPIVGKENLVWKLKKVCMDSSKLLKSGTWSLMASYKGVGKTNVKMINVVTWRNLASHTPSCYCMLMTCWLLVWHIGNQHA